MNEGSDAYRELAQRAKAASPIMALAATARKNAWLLRAADALENRCAEILEANDLDVRAAIREQTAASKVDRLRLTPERVRSAAAGLRQVAALPDPVGQVREAQLRPNGLRVAKVGVPLGVILFIYESRPNVTVDAAGVALKAGNSLILRGGTEAARSNRILHQILQTCLVEERLPKDALQMVDNPDRAAVGFLLKLGEFIDLVIPRGGEELIRRVADEARMHVLKHFKGNCHVYVDRAADTDMAHRILMNAKCQRPGVCNAAESLLVHQEIAGRFLPAAVADLRSRGVEVRGCERTRQIADGVAAANESDFAAEFLALIISVKVVADLEEAIAHIERYGSHHTDAIVTQDARAAERFTAAVDSAAVLVNASTRFNDGFELGLGAEIGISTDKFHARGPCGLLELTSYKYVVHGDGQVREEPAENGP